MFSAKIREKEDRRAKPLRWLSIISIAALALILGAAVPPVWAEEDPAFEDGEIFFELNDTDGDLGIHGEIDGGPWKQVWIKDPGRRTLLNVVAKTRLRNQAVTELFFESAEPTFDELDPEDFFRRFPQGQYTIYGVSEDDIVFSTTTRVRHVMPAQPGLTEVVAAADNGDNGYEIRIDINGETDVVIQEKCDDEGPGFDPTEVELDDDGNIVISWPAVEDSHPTIGESGEIEVIRYQGVVEFETEDEFEAKYTVDLPPSATSFTVPGSFLALGLDEDGEGDFKYEILVREESGNQTAIESCFAVTPAGG